MSELDQYIGMTCTAAALIENPKLSLDNAKDFYGDDIITDEDLQNAFPPTLAGIISAAEARLGYTSKDAFLSVTADDI